VKYWTIDEWENADSPSFEAIEHERMVQRVRELRDLLALDPDEGPFDLSELEALWEELDEE